MTDVSSYKRPKAVRCGSFEGSSLEDRSYVTGDFGGNLATWDLEEESPVQEVAGAHSQMINCVTGTQGGRVVTGGRDGEVHSFKMMNTVQKKIRDSEKKISSTIYSLQNKPDRPCPFPRTRDGT